MSGHAEKRMVSLVAVLLLLVGVPMRAATLRVPADHPTIKSAVNRAREGDTVLVDDGTYLEKNIDITSDILVRSKNLFGAVIYGSSRGSDAIFRVRAAARIEGFVLKGSACGIIQRDGPDVRWEARDMVLFDCGTGLSINDAEANRGSADIRRVIMFGSEGSTGISTNDAHSVDVSGCLFLGCEVAFNGYNHLSFRVRDAVALDCVQAVIESTTHRPVPPATSRIETGDSLRVWSSRSLKEPRRLGELLAFLRKSALGPGFGGGAPGGDRAARDSVLALTLAMASVGAGDHEAAAKSYEAARTAGERAGSREMVWQALWGSARNEGTRGAYGEALRRGRESVDHLERWIPRIPAGIYSINFLEDKAPVFETIIGLLLDRHSRDPLGGYDRQAFLYAERAKSLARLLPAKARGKSRDAEEKIAAAQRELQDPDLSGQEKERLVSLLEKAEDDLHAAWIKEEREWAGPSAPSPLDYPGVRGRLRGRALLSFFLGAKRSFAFLATGEALRCAELPAAGEIEAKVGHYLRFLQIEDGRGFGGERAGKLLFEMLLSPILEKAGEMPRRLIIVPDGRLFYLPFEALVRAGGGEGGGGTGGGTGFWTADVEISYASSATQALAGLPWGMAGGRATSLLAVGNSGGIRCDNRSRDLKQFFLPLAHVRREIKALAGSYPWLKATVLVDEEAGEGRFKKALAAGYDIIHLAAHGVIDDASWWRSALLLRPEPGLGEDGFLTALEIAALDIPARLVVLSGCGTGAGVLFRGEGIKGMSGAFLGAGADYVLVSLWNADDRTTAVFMENFYGFLAEGDSPARASARAKLGLIRSGLRNPFYWAPFVLIGRASDGD